MNELKRIVITGASTGIGAATALHLDQQGYQVFAGVRRLADAESLRQQASNRLVPVLLDVTDAAQIAAAVKMVETAVRGSGLDGLVNNAGVSLSGPMETVPIDDVRRQLEVNAVGAVAVTQAFLPLLRQAQGRIINMSSISGRMALPLAGPYAMSKYALEAFSDALRRELMPWNMHVVVIEPGVIETPIWGKAEAHFAQRRAALSPRSKTYYGAAMSNFEAQMVNASGLPPQAVARIVYQALTETRPKTRYPVGKDAQMGMLLSRILPERLFDKLVTRDVMGNGKTAVADSAPPQTKRREKAAASEPAFPKITRWLSDADTIVDVQDLTFTYMGARQPAIRRLNFQIARGEIFGFLGPSGAGKTTTQKILNGLLKGYEGDATVLGQEVHSWGPDYYEHIGVSFELPNHYQKLSALENLTYFSALYQGETVDPGSLLAMVGLQGDGDLLVSQFSKGMKNRLSVARSLLHRPELIFLDEPTAGLDPVNAQRIKELIRSLKEAGHTIFLTTHDMHVADELCDQVAFIVDGAIELIDSPRNLKLQYGKPLVQVEFQANGHLEQAAFDFAGLGENGRFLELLRSDSIQTLHSQEATLADIFIEVTGRGLS